MNPDHLFLGTNADNNADMVAKGRGRKLKGEEKPESRLTEREVKLIREMRSRHSVGNTGVVMFLSRWLQISQSTISKVANKTAWKHL